MNCLLTGALDGVAPNRRQTLWNLPVLHQDRSAQNRRVLDDWDAGQETMEMPIYALLSHGIDDFSFEDGYWKQWQALGFSPVGHPIQFLREVLSAQGVITCAELQQAKPGQRVRIGGLVADSRRPPTARDVCFVCLEDETALAHAAIMPDVYHRIGAAIYAGGPVIVTGQAERRGGEGMSLLVDEVKPC